MPNDYRIGSIIEYVAFGGLVRRVRVDEKDSNIKNGRPGFSGELVNSTDDDFVEVWGYDSQITRVVKF